MSSLLERVKRQLEKQVEKEVLARMTPVLDALKSVIDEQKKTNELLAKILEVLKGGKEA